MKTRRTLAALAATTILAIPFAAQATTLSGTAGGNDSWNDGNNWDFGVPSGPDAAVVATGVTAKVDNAGTQAYSGGLTLNTNAKLQVGSSVNDIANANALGSGTITMNGGNEIISRAGLGNYTFNQDIVLSGDGIIWAGISTTNHHTTKTLSGEISGPGKLTWNGVNGTWGIIDGSNSSWIGGFETADPQGQRHRFRADADGCFGSGDVTINSNCSLYISAGLSSTMGDTTAALSVNGVSSSDGPSKVVLDSDETVLQFWVNGVQQAAGTYDSTFAETDGGGKPIISGAGVLTVLENPGAGALMELAATDPADDATDVRITQTVLTATFSKPVVLNSGSITLRNLTDASSVAITVGDPRLSISGTVLTIAPGAGNELEWAKDYAVWIDSSAVESDTAIPFAGFSDDTTWNFSTLPGDPLILAMEALEDHITGTAPLTGPQIAVHSATLDSEKPRFDETADIITTAFDLVETYDTTPGFGPLWVNTGQFDRNAYNEENIGWAVLKVMQGIIDEIYTVPNLVTHAGLIDGFKFDSTANFPGSVAPPAPGATHTATINGSYLDTPGWPRQHDEWAARKPTGTYLAPGTIATVTVPPALVNAGYQVRVGAHSWDHEAKNRRWVRRPSRCTTLFDIADTSFTVSNPLGGGIYIEVPYLANAGVVNVEVAGAVRSPFFSAKSFHATTLSEWVTTERNHPAPWADFQSEKFMAQVPTNWVYNMSNPDEMLANWDLGIDFYNDLMGFPRDRGKETIYEQVDVLNRSSVFAPGYPTVNTSDSNPTRDDFGGDRSHYITRGPQIAPDWVMHEAGHAYFFPKFGGESESTVNLPHAAVWHQGFGYTLDYAHAATRGEQGNPNKTADNTAVEWMLMFNFSPRENEMDGGHKVYQLKGHAKYIDVARLFGWEALGDFWGSFVDDYEASSPTPLQGPSFATDDDSMILRLSKAIGADATPLIHFWGNFPNDPVTLAADIAAEGLGPSPEIYDLLEHYKTLIPADNAEFQTYTFAWWGRQPVPGNSGTEWEHGRQWDSTDIAPTYPDERPNGELYDAAAAAVTTQRLQDIIDEYFPSGDPDPLYVSVPNPDPMTFAVAPNAGDPGQISMTAIGATDINGPVEYQFENITNATLSGWSTNASWTELGLAGGQTYHYRVKARNSLGNETSWSTSASATAEDDLSPPTPSPMAFDSPPNALGESVITMTATVASDLNGVEYYFENTTFGDTSHDSGWQDSPVYTDTGLAPATLYGYRVRARDKSAAQNATAWSGVSSDTTDVPDLTAPSLAGLSPLNGATGVFPDTNLVAIFDENIAVGTGNVQVRLQSNDSVVASFAVTSGEVTFSGAQMTIDPTSSLPADSGLYVEIPGTAVQDLAGNFFGGFAGNSTWAFTTLDPSTLTVFTGTTSTDWITGTNWTGGVPTGTIAAAIQTSQTALANSNTVVGYSGGLTLQNGSTLQIGSGGSTQNRDESALAIGTGTITMETGSKLQWQMKVSPTMPPIVLNGDASIVLASNESHSRQFTFAGGISGSGQLTFLGVNNGDHKFNASSPSWSGGFVGGINSNCRTRYNAQAAMAFGTGNVTINNCADLEIENSSNPGAIDDSATLSLNGQGRDSSPSTKLILSNSGWTETVSNLVVDGNPAPNGTYGRVGLGGVDYNVSYFSGNGVLEVVGASADSTAPTIVSIVDNVSGGPIFEDLTPIVFTVTFDESIDPATVAADNFVNTGTNGGTIGTITQTVSDVPLASVFEVDFNVSGTGTVNLQVVDGSTKIADLAGNELVAPVSDDVTITIMAGTSPPKKFLGTVSSNNVNDWITNGNWDATGTPGAPFGSLSGIIAAGVLARSDAQGAPVYSGGLTIESGATLRLGGGGSTQNRPDGMNALGTGTVTMEDGSTIEFRHRANSNPFTFPAVAYSGDVSTVFASNESHNKTRIWPSISGSGKFTVSGTNNNYFRFTGTNSVSGTLIIAENSSNRTQVEAEAPGSLGTWDITSNYSTSLQLEVAGTIDDGARLALIGEGRNNSESKLKFTGSWTETIGELWLDGVQLADGAYTATSSPGGGGAILDVDGTPMISGAGTLVVSGGGGPAPSAFDTWATSNGVPTGSEGTDSDSGGLNNLGEFGLGGDPLDGNDDGSLLHAFSDNVAGGAEEEGILTILVRSGASFGLSGNDQVSAAVDGIVYTVAGDSTLPVASGSVVTGTPAVTTGLPPAPAGYEYASFYVSGAEGYFQVTVEPAP